MKNLSNQIRVVYEDNHLLAVFKPACMLVQGDITGDLSLLDWAKDMIRNKYHKKGRVFIGLVHRLDRPTSGIILFARTSKAAARLSQQFRRRSVEKTYWAVVAGRLLPPMGELRAYLKRTKNRSSISSPGHKSAKNAMLHYRSIAFKEGLALLEIRLVTGRHHQIRAQLAAKGHPILGDLKYGSQRRLPNGQIALLAKSLTCLHPTRPTKITFQSPIPNHEIWRFPRLRKLPDGSARSHRPEHRTLINAP
jgi:23S rRNA pseudouridine1911/1915/1917 synthase